MILHTQAEESQGTVRGTKGGVALTGSLLNSLGLLAHHSRLAVPSLHGAWCSVPSPVSASRAVWDRDSGSQHVQQCHRAPKGWFSALPQGCRPGECKATAEDCEGWRKDLSAVRSLLARITGVSNLPKRIQTVPWAELVGEVPDKDRCEQTVQQHPQSGACAQLLPGPLLLSNINLRVWARPRSLEVQQLT